MKLILLLDYLTALLLKISGQLVSKVFPSLRRKEAPEFTRQQANDAIDRILSEEQNEGYMMAKLGTYELKAFICFDSWKNGCRVYDLPNIFRNRYALFRGKRHAAKRLCNNAGFFPNNEALLFRYAELFRRDWREVDLLSSYQREEAYLWLEHRPKITVDLNGFYAPFLFEHPWTRQLKGKRVLVVSPFVDSIRRQYEHRELLFANPEVLPELKELICVRAVQSIAGNPVDFPDWFAALDSMKAEIDRHDFDIALIGCGAYGFHLAAHVKRRGKISIQLAGWLQFLFGIYGNRWTNDQPEFAQFINENWIRPGESERPDNSQTVEGGCYW